ncbi:hypothetical protein [Amycolatopsis saalfeldensis]|uniref:Secreted protein n=1 Tax=Amycolatopsis saalfeldensis TaxID=394193 RepID=A0A1H8YP06_9PSEU|nr:hypothetical protein [Amycolatopsis saalfeldensis]SEP53813.1 hypothetical protein SAMN04489732_13152 [Amycolatopsis saalfeldensis]
MHITKKLMVGVAGLALTAGLSVTGAGTASANTAQNCGATTAPITVSHPVSIMDNDNRLGILYLGYFGDCKGVYAEIHWNFGPSNPVPPNPAGEGEMDVYRPAGTVYVEGENKDGFPGTNFAKDHLDGTYTTSPIEDIHYNRWGGKYAPPLKFLPDVDLTVYRTDSDWTQHTDCSKHMWGNWHTFSDGGWGSGIYLDC